MEEVQVARLIYVVENLTTAVQNLDNRVDSIESLILKGRGFFYGISLILVALGAILHHVFKLLW